MNQRFRYQAVEYRPGVYRIALVDTENTTGDNVVDFVSYAVEYKNKTTAENVAMLCEKVRRDVEAA